MANRLFAIGDIHACNIALRTLIGAIEPRPDDTIMVLGDIIDWGPDSRDCVQQLIDLSGCCQFILVRGNHEEMLFAALESQSELRYWLNFGGEEILKSYPIAVKTSSSTVIFSDFSRPKAGITTRPPNSSSSMLPTTQKTDGGAVQHDAPMGVRPA